MRNNLTMKLEERVEALDALGKYILEFDDRLVAHMARAEAVNPWFTRDNIEFALRAIGEDYLDKKTLMAWAAEYDIRDDQNINAGIVAAGNIPAVGFHDLLSVFVAGHRAIIRFSERDEHLIPFLIKKLGEIDSRATSYFEQVEKLKGFDAVIATGSDNSARYFRQYFKDYPHIIRRNKNAVAVLTGKESAEDLQALGADIFRYFGLGCRSVSHAFVPEGYDFALMEASFEPFGELENHSKYKNNLDYHHSIYIINQDQHKRLPGLLLVENENLISPVGCLYYTTYKDGNELRRTVHAKIDDIQCIVSVDDQLGFAVVPPGSAQRPGLADYADGIDTLQFLTGPAMEKL